LKILRDRKENSGKREIVFQYQIPMPLLDLSFIFKFNLEEKLALYGKSSVMKTVRGKERKNNISSFNFVKDGKEFFV
jgi:hypothetical protein